MDRSNGNNVRRNTRKRRAGAMLRKGSIFNDVTVEKYLDFKQTPDPASTKSNLNSQNHRNGNKDHMKHTNNDINDNDNNKDNDNDKDDDEPTGDGYYVSGVLGSRRYYGILVDQAAFKLASTLHIQDGIDSLELNRRMQELQEQHGNKNDGYISGRRRPRVDSTLISSGNTGKRPRLSSSPPKTSTDTSNTSLLHSAPSESESPNSRAVQKFKYAKPTDKEDGYRFLLATYANIDAASEDDQNLYSKIKAVCRSGGDWIGAYYYQYEVPSSVLHATSNDMKYDDLGDADGKAFRNSMSFPAFLQHAMLPSWYPLCNTNCKDTNKVLKKFQMKPTATTTGGKVVIDVDADINKDIQTTKPAVTTTTPTPTATTTTTATTTASTTASTTVSTTPTPTAKPKNSTPKTPSSPMKTSTRKPSPKNDSLPIKMKPRAAFRVGIVGGGLAGLSTALELLRMAEPTNENLDIEVTIFEARDCVGGRLKTDSSTFLTTVENGRGASRLPFPVDLGAGWIHGVSRNPLADLAKEAGVECVRASEEVKMLAGGMKAVDTEDDVRVGELFNTLLDRGAKKCWKKDEYNISNRNQMATRWYAEHLHLQGNKDSTNTPRKTDVPAHRYSSDSTIDTFLGKALEEWYVKTPEKLAPVEQNLLLWNTKNAEYALGANISDLSMKYWDADESHAFGGDHVILKGGFASLSDHLLKKCEKYGRRFKVILNRPVNQIYYGLVSSSRPYPKSHNRKSNTLHLSDTCRVVCENGNEACFDFAVCALPLGVLKRGVHQQKQKQTQKQKQKQKLMKDQMGIHFYPPLPKTKRDAIENVGFGLLNKVYIQFPNTFWRKVGSVESLSKTPFLAKSQRSFGNVSGLNPHHYMFFDVGRCVNGSKAGSEPAILLTLISGSAAVEAEQTSDASLLDEIMSTLRHLFSDIEIPPPTCYKATKWGSDKYSCGSYTFLPPGTSDQDYQILQSPINKSGELISGTGKGDMRLFWAGEHTSFLFPSMAHGAFHSGTRAAKDVFTNINVREDDDSLGIDRQIPTSVYRERHPSHPVQCGLCSLPGRMEEGAILAFQRGTRDALVHSRCAEYSPEVDMRFGVWKHVIKAVSRGKKLKCVGCGRPGATIGCQDVKCKENYHFRCCKGWDFVKLGKEFRCALHRPQKQEKTVLSCYLCRKNEDSAGTKLGRLISFEKGNASILVHFNCMQYTNIVDMKKSDSYDKKVTKVFESISLSKKCSTCNVRGATIKCFVHHCTQHVHFSCLVAGGWDFWTQGSAFFCPLHRIKIPGPIFICGPKPTEIYDYSGFKEPSKIIESIRSLQNNRKKKQIGQKVLGNGTPTTALKAKNGDNGHTAKPSLYSSDNSDFKSETESMFNASESEDNTESEVEIEVLNSSGNTSSFLRMISGAKQNIIC